MNIVCFSNQTWDWPLHTNKRLVMERMAQRGHQVLFIDPPLRFRKIFKEIVQGRWPLKRMVSQTYRPQENVAVYTPVTRAPSESPDLVGLNLWEMRNLIPKDAVIWVYHPSMIEYVKRIPRQWLVYDCVDDYPNMANYRRWGLSGKVAQWEEELAREADVVFASAPGLMEKMKEWNEKVHYTPNAGDYERFEWVGRERLAEARRGLGTDPNREKVGPESRKGRISLNEHKIRPRFGSDLDSDPFSIRIGFTGAIDDYKVNLGLIERCAQEYPEYSFVLIGPQGVADTQPNLQNLKKLENVRFLGQKPYEQMPDYFSEFDVYIIPYNLNDYTVRGCFPVKFHDALAAGLPTVVTDLPAYEPFGEVAYIAKDDVEFVKLVKRAWEEDSVERIEARQRIAKKNSWDRKVDKMLRILEDL